MAELKAASGLRPSVRFLEDSLIERIVAEARDVLTTLGVDVHHAPARALLCDHGAHQVDSRLCLTESLIDRALEMAPGAFCLHGRDGNETHDFSEDRVHFTPGSAAIYILDPVTAEPRVPVTADYVRYAKLVNQLGHIAAQSTAFIPRDVPEAVSDSYRLYLSLLYGTKPVVTGTFGAASFAVMRDMLAAVRGSDAALAEKPMAIFSCCPTAPLKWSESAAQTLIGCARLGVPVEYVSMPLPGFVAPVTIVGSLVQHTAETLSGLVISQLARPGAPVLYGGSPAVFDIRYETTPMGAVETQMLECAYSEIGKHLGLPTQAYMALSDAKCLDAQAGLETGMGATLAVLAGINNVSGPGMLDFENCLSLEKLVLDHEICRMALRLGEGVRPREDFPSLPRFRELLEEGHLLISEHTRRHLRDEHHYPGPIIDRTRRPRWEEEGRRTLRERAREEVDRAVAGYEPSELSPDVRSELTRLMTAEARAHGMDALPGREP